MSGMSEYGADHAQISAVFLRLSREYLANGNLLQASEKGWGAAAHAAMLVAAVRGWTYQEHRDFDSEIIPQLARETGQRAVYGWGRSANDLHRNFYRDELDGQQIAARLDDIANLVNLIRRLADLPPIAD